MNGSITGNKWVNSSPPPDNMAIILQTIFSNAFFHEILIPIALKYVPMGPINNKSALVQVMAWCCTGDKPLPQPMLTQFTDEYMQH